MITACWTRLPLRRGFVGVMVLGRGQPITSKMLLHCSTHPHAMFMSIGAVKSRSADICSRHRHRQSQKFTLHEGEVYNAQRQPKSYGSTAPPRPSINLSVPTLRRRLQRSSNTRSHSSSHPSISQFPLFLSRWYPSRPFRPKDH